MIFLYWVLLFLLIVPDSYPTGIPSVLLAERWPDVSNEAPTWHQEIHVSGEMSYGKLLQVARRLWRSVAADNGRSNRRLCMTSTGACFVAALYVPSSPQETPAGSLDGWIYASTVPRGRRADVMKYIVSDAVDEDGLGVNGGDLVWWKSARGNWRGWRGTTFHAEDGCFFNYETSGRAWFPGSSQTIYPHGSRIALWGVYDHSGLTEAEWQTGREIFPCRPRPDRMDRGRDPSCLEVTSDLGVAVGNSPLPQRRLPSSYSGSWGEERWARVLRCAEQRMRAHQMHRQSRKVRDTSFDSSGTCAYTAWPDRDPFRWEETSDDC